MKLIIGNKNYSSWSLRGWLAAKQSGIAFEEITIPLYGDEWESRKREEGNILPSAGRVPVLWDGEIVVWDSLAILEFLSDRVGRDRFWPKADDARAAARSMVAEMHSGFMALRAECPMNIRRRITDVQLSEPAKHDIIRVLQLWAEARSRFARGGPFLFGTFCAADIFYAPVVGRFLTYGIPVPGFAQAYMEAVWEHEWMRQWVAAAETEQWEIQQFETPRASRG